MVVLRCCGANGCRIYRWCGGLVAARVSVWQLHSSLGQAGQGHPQPLALHFARLDAFEVRVARCLLLALLAGPSLCIAQPNRFRHRGTPFVRGL